MRRPGLSKPAYLASKNAERPVQSEVSALDYYIEHFVWGGLQRTTARSTRTRSMAFRTGSTIATARSGPNGRTHIWRIYDYPHITLMYFGMYRVAKHNPQIKTALMRKSISSRLRHRGRACSRFHLEVERWSAYQTGLYNELVILDVMPRSTTRECRNKRERLRTHWERKVRRYR